MFRMELAGPRSLHHAVPLSDGAAGYDIHRRGGGGDLQAGVRFGGDHNGGGAQVVRHAHQDATHRVRFGLGLCIEGLRWVPPPVLTQAMWTYKISVILPASLRIAGCTFESDPISRGGLWRRVMPAHAL